MWGCIYITTIFDFENYDDYFRTKPMVFSIAKIVLVLLPSCWHYIDNNIKYR